MNDNNKYEVIIYNEKLTNGGIESLIINYIKYINEIKFKIIIAQKETTMYDNFLSEKKIEVEEILKNKIKSPIKRTLFVIKNIRKTLKNNNKNAILHINVYNSVGLLYAFIAKTVGYSRIIVHAHNNGIDNDKLMLKRIFNKFCKLIFDNDTYLHIACSNDAATFCFKKKNYEILDNGIDCEKFKFDKNERNNKRKELGLTKENFVIGNVGRLVEQKNHNFLLDVFIELYKKNKNAILLIIGKGPLEYKLLDKIEKNNIQKNVIIISETNEIEKYFCAMDYFLLPSKYEGFGLVLIEAQLSGLKCISSCSVPIETKITNNIEYLEIDEPKKWLNRINVEINERITKTDIINSKYDIRNSCDKLKKIYIKQGR